MYKAVYQHLLATYGRRPGYWFNFFAGAIQAFITRIYGVIIMANIASSIATGDLEAAKRYTLTYLIAYIAAHVIGLVGELTSILAENRVYSQLLVAFHRKLINKDMRFYQDNQTGYLASAFRQYLDSSIHLARFWHGEALGTAISLVAPVVVLMAADLRVGLVALLVILLQLGYVIWSSSSAQQYRTESHEIYRRITGEVSDQITNILAFKSSGAERKAAQAMTELATQETDAFWKRRKTTAILDLPRSIITAFGVTAAIYFVIDRAQYGDPNALGLVVLTTSYMFQIIRNVRSLPNLIDSHDDYVAKIYPTLSYLSNIYETVTDPAKPVALAVTQGTIALNEVDFSYPSHLDNKGKVPVFSGLTLQVKGGEQIGIVGLSGAGKSTLASLLLRFNDVDAGSITIDGTDIRDVSQSELRQKIAYVPQEPLLFHRTVRENIAYFVDDVSDKAIAEAAKAAHAHEFITELPNGYETIVGERGVKLSGGQKQRVAIARAILKKAPILIFDEATSALDSESEQIIQRALPNILGKQTAIVIAHRLSTIAGLDRIIVMDKGKIIEEGTHQQLLKQKGRYYSLWLKQTER